MSEYSLRDKVPIAGMLDEDGNPMVELGAIETVPDGLVILQHDPVEDEYAREARPKLTPREAREVAQKLIEMADKLENE